MERPSIRLLIDENVPTSVARFLRERGHEVRFVQEEFARGTEDAVIARMASELSLVVVTWNYRHFKALAAKRQKSGRPSYPNMGLIAFACGEAEGAARLAQFLHLVEAEYEHRQSNPDKRLLVEIGPSYFRVLR